jgi:hypothetical protein
VKFEDEDDDDDDYDDEHEHEYEHENVANKVGCYNSGFLIL